MKAVHEQQFNSPSRKHEGRSDRALREALCLMLFLVLTCGVQSGSMQSQQPLSQSLGQRATDQFGDMDDHDPVEREKQLRALNAERQKSLVADTNKLLKLAADLNAEINNANAGSLTLDRIQKLSEIEKLAHSVKEKMSTSVRTTPVYEQQFPPHLR
jgi:hypothetical protein